VFADASLVLEFAGVAEVDQESDAVSSGRKAAVDLCSMIVGQFGYGLEFDDDRSEASRVRLKTGLEGTALVGQAQRAPGFMRNAAELELDGQALLVHNSRNPSPLSL